MTEGRDVPDELVAAAQRYDVENRTRGGWQRVPDDQVRRLLTGARQLLMEVMAESMGDHLRVVPADDLRLLLEVAANYLDMCEPPPAAETAALERLRAAAGSADA